MLHEVPRELLPVLAERLRALGDPVRLQVMQALTAQERTVGELAELTGVSQPTVTRQIDRLEQSGWVLRRRDGNRVYVRLADEVSAELCDCLCGLVRRQAAALAARAGVKLSEE